MAQINIPEAQTSLSQLIERARSGEEIIIARAGTPMARLVPIDPVGSPRRLGIWEGRVTLASDWDSEVVDREIVEMLDADDA